MSLRTAPHRIILLHMAQSIQLIADPAATSEYHILELPREIAALLEAPAADAPPATPAGTALTLGGKRKRGDGDFNWDAQKRV